MAIKKYYDTDCNLGLLDGKTVAVIGFGSQGHAHSENLAESGVNVVVGLRKGSSHLAKAEEFAATCPNFRVMEVEEAAKAGNIPVQKDIMRAGGTDAGAIHTTRLGVLTGGVSIPCRYIHTPVEMADLNDTKHCADLLLAFVCRKLEPIIKKE